LLVFKSQRSVEGLLRGKFTLGADAAVAAGPLGRRAEAATDTSLQAEIYSYSRSRGLFAGISLEGSALQVDDAANAAYYGGAAAGIAPAIPPAALQLVDTIARLTAHPPAAAAVGNTLADGSRGPMPAAGPPAAGLATAASPAVAPDHLDMVQGELAKAATSLQPLLDENWRRYLALPAEVFERGRRPSAAALGEAVARFNAVARHPQYESLVMRPEFHNTHRWLQALYEDVRASGTPQLALPPPPAVGVR
jgi:hypothetical protein